MQTNNFKFSLNYILLSKHIKIQHYINVKILQSPSKMSKSPQPHNSYKANLFSTKLQK